ncbi:MAG: CoA-binding protein, partial [Candidatus Thorarchaeota archaeon]
MTNTGPKGLDEIDPFFNPSRVALVGASSNYRKLGNSILMNLLTSEIDVFPVTHSREQVLGVKAYPSLDSLPEPVDLVIVAVAAKYCPGLMSQIQGAGAKAAVVISGGFSET